MLNKGLIAFIIELYANKDMKTTAPLPLTMTVSDLQYLPHLIS